MSAYDMMSEVMIAAAEQCITPDADASLALVMEQCNNIRNSYLKKPERRIELLIYRLYDVKHFAARAGVEDVVRYVKDDEYFRDQQAKLAALTDGEQGAALFDQALALVNAKDYAAAGELFRQAALLGHVGAQYNYGVSLASGEVGEPDALQACYWYWKAGRGGSTKALVNLAIAYRNGTGVKDDWNQMLYFYATAALALEPHAVYNMGLALAEEGGTEKLQQIGRLVIARSVSLENEEAARLVRVVAQSLIDQLTETASVITLP